ncbi:hypothetical protein IT568_06920, partial [bacterium]|nr:hypothetical protein [bacterium]
MRLKSLALIAALFLISSKINAQTIFTDTFESSTGWTLTGDWQIDSTWAGGGSPGGTTNFP